VLVFVIVLSLTSVALLRRRRVAFA
jgi:hypothetical protein